MASEIRVDKITHTAGVGTITPSPTGVHIAGIVTGTTFSGSGASLTNLPAANVTGTLPAISGANLTNLPAANVTGTLPAISGANLTNLTAANLTGTIADARFPATLPAASAANLTSVPAAQLTGTLPALSAASLTSIPAANIVGLATAGFERTGGFGGGKILKVLQAVKTSGQDITSSSFTDITDLSITLTPAATSKCLVHAVVTGYAEFSSTYYGTNKMQIVRGSTSIGVALRNIRLQTHSSVDYLQVGTTLTQSILDTHGADGSTAVTYKCQGLTNHGHMYVNSSFSTYSSLTVYEVAPN